ncbi:phosphotransferase family protein [Arthrobacter monumenti]
MENSRLKAFPGEEADIALLESAAMHTPLQLALETAGLRLTEWKLVQTHHRPHAGVTAIYETVHINAAGESGTDFVCATTAKVPATTTKPVVRLSAPATVDRTESGEQPELTLWRHPLDPLLPGLAWACDSAAVAEAVFGKPGADIQLRTISYRPLRRAVIAATFEGEEAFLKVVRSGRADVMYRRHRMLTEAGIPAPEPYAPPQHDVLALRKVTGTPLAQDLLDNGAMAMAPETLIDLLRRIPAEAMELPARPSWASRAGDYAMAAAAALPAERSRIMDVAARIMGLLPSTDPGPVVPSHGDFYEANLLVDGGKITGVLDVDAVGPGLLVDDLACFIGHLAVLPAVDARYVRVPSAMQRFLAGFDTAVDPAGLRIRAAGVALSLIAGAKRSGTDDWYDDALGRLEATEKLADAAVGIARYVDSENSLIPGSKTSHIEPAV